MDIEINPQTEPIEIGEQESIEFEAPKTEHNVNEDYNKLENKPQINGVELDGDKTLNELGIASKEVANKLREDLGSNFGDIQEDLYYKLVNNQQTGRVDGTIGSTITFVNTSRFVRFKIDVEEYDLYYIKYKYSSTDIKYIYIVDENDTVLQIVDSDIAYSNAGIEELNFVIPQNAKYLYFTSYATSANFKNNPREYAELKVTKKEVLKNMVDSLYGKTGKFKTLDLSDYSQNLSSGGINPLTELTEDGIYQVRGKGCINFGSQIYDFNPGDIVFRSDDGNVVSFVSGLYGSGYFSYDSSEESYVGGYYTTISDVIYEIERLTKKTINTVSTILANLTVNSNYEYRRINATGSTNVRVTISSTIRNLSDNDTASWKLSFRTNETTQCTWTWATTTEPVKYVINGIATDTFTPELGTWYNIEASWEGQFWLLKITGIKGA